MSTAGEEKRSMVEAAKVGCTVSTTVSLPRNDQGLESLFGKPFAEVLLGCLLVKVSTKQMLAVEGC